MDTQTDVVAHDEQPRGGRGDPDRPRQLAALRADLAQSARRQGYLDLQQWQTARAHLDALNMPAEDQAQLATDLAQLAAKQHWLFPEEPLPADGTSPVDALVTRARAQTQRTRLITQSYLSAILALGCRWGVSHDELAQALARACAAEHWTVDWELACEMEGLLGAERASDRQRVVRSQAQQVFEQNGKKGWLSESDLLRLYTSMRGFGVSDVDTRDLLASFHLDADARRWAWAGAAVRPRPADETLELLVSKVAEQAHRRQRVGEGFHQALMAEADEPTSTPGCCSRRLPSAANASTGRRSSTATGTSRVRSCRPARVGCGTARRLAPARVPAHGGSSRWHKTRRTYLAAHGHAAAVVPDDDLAQSPDRLGDAARRAAWLGVGRDAGPADGRAAARADQQRGDPRARVGPAVDAGGLAYQRRRARLRPRR